MAKRLIDEVVANAPNRRGFLRKLAVASAATAVVGGTMSSTNAQTAPGPSDADILNFALNLEYLEAEFYSVATAGKTIDQYGISITGTGNQGATTGGQQVNFTNSIFATSDIANQIAVDERAHVNYIRTALMAAGAMPIAKPAINLNALGFGFNGLMDFLQLARAFEDVGVTAYAGAAPLIADKTILGAAARIAEVESFHASSIRLQVAKLGIPTTRLDGADILPPPSGQNYFPVDKNGLTQIRTPGQVLFLVYGFQANVTAGGFFPSGVNGTLNMSSAGVSTANLTNASVTPSNLTTSQPQITLDASASTSAGGGLTYLFMVLPGGKVPAILQTPGNPKAIIEFVNGPGMYLLQLIVTDGNKNTSTQNITINYTGV